ncbi:probable cytochrome P450 313a4 [Sabethes cyaneus]|uniref:probable cytochrome P450 313a4 n=1 Tax=Sabethes cyaneus TaxID=53552 RepID=UPI00237DE0A6|nr:probable cytochrome P450 313a4 [Sabethes cyaneus]
MWLLLLLVIILFVAIVAIIGGEYWSLYGKNEIRRFGAVVGMFRNCSRMFRIWLGPFSVLCTNHPEVIRQILSNPDCMEKPFFYRFTGLESGLLSAEHHVWRSQRKLLNSTFNLKILNSFIPIFETCCKKMIQNINQLENGSTINILNYASKCTLEMVCGTTIGMDDGSTINILNYASKCTLEMVCGTTIGMDVLESNNKEVMLGYIQRLFNLVSKRMLNVHLYFDWIYCFTRNYWEERMLRSVCMQTADQLIIEKRRFISGSTNLNKNMTNNMYLEIQPKIPKIFIEQLLEDSFSSRKFTSKEIYHNAYTIILAGNDTSALSVAYACLFLAMYPHIQDRIHAEIQHFLPSEDTPITPENLKQLEYMDMFVKETLRHCPAIPVIARKAIKNVSIDNQVIPKNSIIIMSLYTLHRRKDIWGPNATNFDPENFHPDRIKLRDQYAYLPFSGGPRNCIGWRYALMNIKVMLVYLVRNFSLRTDIKQTDLRFRFDLTLKLAFEHRIQLEKRRVD